MEILKRNLGLTIFLALSLIVALVLIVFTRQHANAVRKSQAEFEDVKNFVGSLRQQRIAINDDNLETARQNSELADDKLQALREALRQRSQMNVEPMSSVQFKNHLVSTTRDMLRELTQGNVQVADAAKDFSFAETLQASSLPDPQVDVPVLTRQLLMVQELVRLIGQSGIRELIAVQRVAGLGSVELDDYRVTRFEVQVAGPLKSVKQLVTDLQLNAKYYLYVPETTLVAESEVDPKSLKVPFGQAARSSRATSTREPARFPGMMTDPLSRPTAVDAERTGDLDDVEVPRRLPKTERAVVFVDYVTATIPVHVIEFTFAR